ncbi:MAG: 3-dehydroquinate synthase, partial [Desulfobacterales bacterium]
MKTYTIAGASGTSTILVGGQLRILAAHLPAVKVVIITDSNVERYYADRFPPAAVISLAPGEASKSLATVETIYGRLLELEADRTSFIVGIGGGVVCDIAGF